MLAKTLAACTYLSSIVPSYTMLKSMRKSKNRYCYHIFVSPGDAPGAITLNVAWMEGEFDAYKLSRSMYACVFKSFPVIRTASAKNRRFHVPQPTFLSRVSILMCDIDIANLSVCLSVSNVPVSDGTAQRY